MNEIAKREEVGRDLAPLRDDFLFPFEKMFDDFFSKFSLNKGLMKSTSSYPKMDILKEDGKLLIKAAVPGVKPEDLKVEIDKDGVLKLSGKCSEEHKSQNGSYYSKELRMSQFSRTVVLPESLKDKDPVANVNNGMLTLSWDYNEENSSPKVRTIAVSS